MIKKYKINQIKYTCKCGFERVYNIDSDKAAPNVVVKCPECGKPLQVKKS